MLAKAGSRKTIGVDLSEKTIGEAKKKYSIENLDFMVGDAQMALFPQDRFDLIVSFETIEHVKLPGEFLLALTKILKPDGTFICSTPVRTGGSLSDKPSNPFHLREWNLSEFKSLLSRYFSEIDILGQSFYFLENPIPFNRTIQKFFCKLFFKNELQKLFRESVARFPDLPKFFNCFPQFQVAVCTKPFSCKNLPAKRKVSYDINSSG